MKDNVYGLIERNPLNVKVTFVATYIYTGKQYTKTYSLKELMNMEGYYHIVGDMTGAVSRDQYVLRVLPNQVKKPFYVYDTINDELTLHYEAAAFADDNMLSRRSVSDTLSKKQENASGFKMWYVGETPPEHIVKGVEKGEVVHRANTWEELARIIDVSKQALSNGYREARTVMGWDVFMAYKDLSKLVACLEVSKEFQESIDIVQQPCYDE